MLDWIFSRLSVAALDVVMEKVVQPFLQIWLKAKDVDLEKFKATEIGAVQLGAAVLDANVKFASIKSGYALSVLQWWPFRLILFVLLLFCSVRFCLILIDSTYWFIFGCTIDGKDVLGDACAWNIPAVRGAYGQAEMEYILFFVIAKPVDTAVSGAIGLASRYLRK